MVRKFLQVILGAVFLLSGCASPPKGKLARYEFETPQMGVPFRIVMYAPSQEVADGAAKAAFKRVSDLNAMMSDYEYDSELSRLGRTSGSGQKVSVSPELWTVLVAARKFSEASGGAFDISVAPLVQVWRKARREKQMPPAESLARMRARVGYTNIDLRDGTVELKAPEMRLDLGAIAKGYAADEALRVLRERGIRRAFAAASGDSAIGDPPPGAKGWKVELLNATNQSGSAFLVLKNCGLATSGDLFQFVEIDGKRYSHILNPKTGVGLTDQSLVTVVAKDGITADALSTTVSVMDHGEGLKLARRFGAEAWEVRILEDGARVESTTANFWKRAVWVKVK
jgi:thiamine biosynthesis lipoprotein